MSTNKQAASEPALLKKISIIYWLQSVCPVATPVPQGNSLWNLLIVDADPAPVSVATLNILLLAALAIALESPGGVLFRQSRIGFKIKPDMPGLKGEVVQALYARGAKWLAGEPAWDAPPVQSGI